MSSNLLRESAVEDFIMVFAFTRDWSPSRCFAVELSMVVMSAISSACSAALEFCMAVAHCCVSSTIGSIEICCPMVVVRSSILIFRCDFLNRRPPLRTSLSSKVYSSVMSLGGTGNAMVGG